MLSNTQQDYALELAEAKALADRKVEVIRASELSVERARTRAAILLSQNVEWESHIKEILQLESRVRKLEDRFSVSIGLLDSKIVASLAPLDWLKRNVWTVISIVAGNAAITGLMIYFFR